MKLLTYFDKTRSYAHTLSPLTDLLEIPSELVGCCDVKFHSEV